MKFEEMYAFIAEEAYAQQNASTKQLLVFLRKRRDGAARIHTQADRKSGPARLTAKHFSVKLPVYDRIIKMVEKNEDLTKLKKEYISILNQLRKNVRQPKKFQELTGKLEVLGEILIETGNM
jgi:hypothetical protein